MENQQPKLKFNLFKTLQNIALIGIFLVVGLGVLYATDILPRTITSIEMIIVIGLILIGVLLVLPWAKYLEEKKYKTLSLVFLIGTAICVVLWVICTFVICHAIRVKSANPALLNLIRVTLLISLQILIASFIGKFVIKYKYKYIPFQVVTYLSLVYIDFYLAVLLFGVSIKSGTLNLAKSAQNILTSRLVIALLILALVYLIVAITIISDSRKRRVRNSILGRGRTLNRDIGVLDLGDDDDDEPQQKTDNNTNDAEAQLEKLKSMLDKGLITQEQYESKRQAIIDKM